MYYNNQIDNMLKGLQKRKNFDTFCNNINYVTDNQSDISAMESVISRGYAEAFDRYDSAVCEDFLCVIEKMYSDSLSVIRNFEVTDEFIKFTKDNLPNDLSDYEGYLEFLQVCKDEYSSSETKLSELAKCDYSVSEYFVYSVNEYEKHKDEISLSNVFFSEETMIMNSLAESLGVDVSDIKDNEIFDEHDM